MKRTIDQLPTAKNKAISLSVAPIAETQTDKKTHSKSGLKWDPKRLAAIPAEWGGDQIQDGDGLVGEIRVAKSNAVSIRYRYAFKWKNKNTWFQCGTWPKKSLADIRKSRDDAQALLSTGVNPTDHKNAEKITNQTQIEEIIAQAATADNENKTFFDMYTDWKKNGVKRKDGNSEIERSFEKDVLPKLKNIPVKNLTEKNLREVLSAMADRDVGRSTEQRYNDLAQLFNWAQKRPPYRKLLVEGNPLDLIDIDIILPNDYDPDAVRERILYPRDIRQLREVFIAMGTTYDETPAGQKYGVPRPMKKENQIALWICLATMCRIGELLMTKWKDVDLKDGIWTVPKENVKGSIRNQKSQTVALSSFGLKQFKELHALTGVTPYCFPNTKKNNHVDLKTVSKIVGDCQTMFKKQNKPLKGRRNDNSLVLNSGQDGNWTPHDLRRTGSTMLQAMGEDTNMIDRCQNHKIDEPKTRAHYMHYKYRLPKRKIWERLGLEIENIFAGKPDWQDQYL
ncbi:MAG: tyrosine-type recombinase/integrase [Rhodoferax sp.]|uniref:tyrosine-type recombinase/integrase n=1 Tax=Rhodoferax sp. TaxID=50421 RepID=UPI00261F4C4F|nr:site-specific integrase [Rhodoferax sp.]MDD2882427.1 tyrosine-type recombinase/integrase [Rhodoferax sp.]